VSTFTFQSMVGRAASCLLALLLIGCQSSPSQLYVLSSGATPAQAGAESAAPSAVLSDELARAGEIRVGVSVVIPEYVDRTDILQRTGANELIASHDAQWGENLSVDAARVLTEDLAARLPTLEFIMLPSRTRHLLDYQIEVDLSRFEGDADGKSLAAGWWTLTDRDNQEVVSGRVWHQVRASGQGYAAMAAAMSRNLTAVSADIATAVDGWLQHREALKQARGRADVLHH